VGTYGDTMLARQRNGGAHHARIACVKPACDISGRNVREEHWVLAQGPGAERLPYVSVEVDLPEGHG
jgi:hypothetical protein